MKPILALETSTATCAVAVYGQSDSSEVLHAKEVIGVSGHAQHILPLIDEVLSKAHVSRSDLAAVAFGQGPGAFTGVRLGCSVAQGIGFALQIPVVPVGALPALASGLERTEQSSVRLVAIDARMHEMYLAIYGQTSDATGQGSGAGTESQKSLRLNVTPGVELQSPILIKASDSLSFIAARLRYWLRAVTGARSLVLAGDGWSLVLKEDLLSTIERFYPELQLDVLDVSCTHKTVGVREVARLGWKLFNEGRRVTPELALPLYLRDKVAFTTVERAQGKGGNPVVDSSDDTLVLPMCVADLREVVELERQSQAFPWSEGHFREALAAGYPGWVIRRADELLGFCVAMIAPDEVHLLVIAVGPSNRHQGLGMLLLEQIYMLGRQHCASRVLLEVRPSNMSAISFYGKQGFEQIGTRRGYYPAAKGMREDAWVMARSLHGERVVNG